MTTSAEIRAKLQTNSAGPVDKNALADLLEDMIEFSQDAAGAAQGTGVSAVEQGSEIDHQTILTLEDVVMPAIAGGANLAIGKKIYTFPAGALIIESAYMSVSFTQTEGHVTADTPDVGLGTVIGSGAVAVLGGTATFENIITGQTAADVNGTPTVKTSIPTANVPLVIEAAGSHDLFLNVADGWAASGDAGILANGTVIINWKSMVAPT